MSRPSHYVQNISKIDRYYDDSCARCSNIRINWCNRHRFRFKGIDEALGHKCKDWERDRNAYPYFSITHEPYTRETDPYRRKK